VRPNSNLNDSELLKQLKTAPAPLSAAEVADLLGSMRHKVIPLLRGLAASGQIEVVDGDAGIPRFIFKQKPGGSSEQFTDNVVNHPATMRRKEDKTAAKPTAKAETQQPKTRAKKASTAANTTGTLPSIESKAGAAVSKTTPTAPKAEAPAPVTSPPVPSAEVSTANLADREKILVTLKKSPMGREAILRQFGAMGDLLQDMIQSGEVSSDHIIDDHVFDLTDKGNQEAEAIIAKLAKVAKVAEEPAVAPVAPVAAVVSPAVVEAPAPVASAPVVAAPAVEPVVEAPAVTPAPIAKKAEKVEEAPKAPESPPSASMDNPIMKQLAELVEKLVAERFTEVTKELEQGKQDRQKLVAVAAGIHKATAALQLGIDALNEVAKIISE
jgi:hypothetical protein